MVFRALGTKASTCVNTQNMLQNTQGEINSLGKAYLTYHAELSPCTETALFVFASLRLTLRLPHARIVS